MPGPPRAALAVLFLVSAALLFLELALIRWVAAEVRVFAYMHNLLLVASFLGVGLGCYRAGSPPSWVRGLLALAAIALIVTDPLRLGIGEITTRGIAEASGSVIWDQGIGDRLAYRIVIVATAVVVTLALVVLTALSLAPFGQALGARMEAHPRPIAAYSANLAGSLAGTFGFFALCALSTSPTTWFAAGAALVAPLVLSAPRAGGAGRLLALLLLLAPAAIVCANEARVRAAGIETVWSPYQKLEVTPLLAPGGAAKDAPAVQAGYAIRVNSSFYQSAIDLSSAFRARNPRAYEAGDDNHYDLPHRVLPRARRLLVVGAGAGNDVAAALRHGAERIDAVDIDPRILDIGRRLHPERPYRSERVRTAVEDARSFFKRATPGAYDVVWFGLLDSHTTASGFTTLRLDHYVYTRESFAEARRLLCPEGVMVCSFAVHRDWIGDRIYGLLRETFDGVAPLAVRIRGDGFSGAGITTYFGGRREALERVRDAFRARPALAAFLQAHQTRFEGRTRLTTDDWPYLYLARPHLPAPHVIVSFAILLVFARLRRGLAAEGGIAWPFFFLGAAFLLLEVLGVSRASLLFGSTWVVTAVVVSGVLCMALLANLWVARSASRALGAPLVGLVLCGAALVLVPVHWFAALGPVARAASAGLFLAAPVFFSGLLFTRLFREAPRKDIALGSNLFGALVGGLCEQASFVFGLAALTAFAIALYVAGVLAAWRGRASVRAV